MSESTAEIIEQTGKSTETTHPKVEVGAENVPATTVPEFEKLTILEKSLELETQQAAGGQETSAGFVPSVPEAPGYKRHYAKIAETRYNVGPLAGHGEALIKAAGKTPPTATVIEVGCNTGMFLEQWKAETGVEIKGFDINEDAVALAREKGLKAEFAPAEKLPLEDNSVDLITSLHTYEHVQDLPKSFKEIARILRPGGKAIIIEPPNFYGLETIRVAIEDMPDSLKGEGALGFIKTYINGWKYARQLHHAVLGGPLGGARGHAEKILKQNQINIKVSGGMKPYLMFSNLLVFEKPAA